MTKPRKPAARKPRGPQQRTRNVSPRRIAFEVLSSFATRQAHTGVDRAAPHVTQLLHDALHAASATSLDRRFITEIVLGVVRRQATLDAILAAYVSRPREQVEAALWLLLQVGIYQLVLMTSVPSHAAVNETVGLASDLGRPQWRGFLNGVLRTLSRDASQELAEIPSRVGVPLIERGEFAVSAADISTAGPRVRFRHLQRLVFPDPQLHPGEYIASAFSYPGWLVDRWLAQFGQEEALRRAAWFDTPGVMSLRVNPLRSSRDQVLRVLATAQVAAQPASLPEGIRLPGPVRVEDLPGFAEGWFSVQDESAMHAAALLDPQPGETILDLCAAPGGKTAHLAERVGNKGRVIACDINPRRLQRVAEGCARLGLTCVETRLIDESGHDIPAGPFDAALVDVPCSNTGVLGKRADVRWRITPADLAELPMLQLRLLRQAIDRVRPGGRILYSTCSSEREENQGVVEQVMSSTANLAVVSEQVHVPGRPADGGYQALLKKL